MSRPRPTIRSPNNHAAFVRQAQVFADRFAAHEGVVGVLLTGGVARGYADHFSEIDLAVYLTQSTFERWTQSGLAPYAEGDSWLDGWHVDFGYLCYEDELEAEWDHVKRWDRSYAVVLHDPRGLMRELLARKSTLANEEKRRLASRYLILYAHHSRNRLVKS
jgi:predicted nucleotidyltransferase